MQEGEEEERSINRQNILSRSGSFGNKQAAANIIYWSTFGLLASQNWANRDVHC